MSAKAPVRPLRLAPAEVAVRHLPDGGMVLSSRQALAAYPRCLGEHLVRWARASPERTFLAERESPTAGSPWRRVTYAGVLAAVERIAAALLARGLGPERPLAILSDNGIDHALMQLAALHVGVPVAPLSTAYSLLSQDYVQLRYLLGLLRPGLVFAADGARFATALEIVDEVSRGAGFRCERVVSSHPPAGGATPFGDLLDGPTWPEGPDVATAFAAVGPETVAKILFTSGSTGRPKGVINTQRMLCSNQQAIAQGWPFLADRPPVLVDWLPWSHTFGGNHNFNLVLAHGGTLYIDGGKPAPGLVEATLANLRAVPSTVYFNVPRGFDMLVPHLERDAALRATFFRDLDVLFYAAAALPQPLWERLEDVAVAATGRRVVMLSAWGSTETAPCATQVHFAIERAGVIGLPLAGIDIKLAPVAGTAGKLELRVAGPNVSPGYWRRPEETGELFDEEGFLKMGDAGRLADAADPTAGILFDGRLGENFKLSSGVWVHVGELRTELVGACAPFVQDLVVTGPDRAEVGVLVFPSLAACRALCPHVADAPLDRLVEQPEVRRALESAIALYNASHPTSSRRITRAVLLAEPPSIDAGEVTDKGYINQRAVLERRAAWVERLYSDPLYTVRE